MLIWIIHEQLNFISQLILAYDVQENFSLFGEELELTNNLKVLGCTAVYFGEPDVSEQHIASIFLVEK
jgi:hypothetical protein